MPRKKQIYDFEFKIRNFAATKQKHQKQIKKLKELVITYDDVIRSNVEDFIVTRIMTDGSWWRYYFVPRVKEKDRLTQSMLKELKSRVNDAMKYYIRSSLEWNKVPISYFTAFYIAYYKRINALMKRATKQLIRHLEYYISRM